MSNSDWQALRLRFEHHPNIVNIPNILSGKPGDIGAPILRFRHDSVVLQVLTHFAECRSCHPERLGNFILKNSFTRAKTTIDDPI